MDIKDTGSNEPVDADTSSNADVSKIKDADINDKNESVQHPQYPQYPQYPQSVIKGGADAGIKGGAKRGGDAGVVDTVNVIDNVIDMGSTNKSSTNTGSLDAIEDIEITDGDLHEESRDDVNLTLIVTPTLTLNINPTLCLTLTATLTLNIKLVRILTRTLMLTITPYITP